MKTKEQVKVTLLADLEYETQEGRDWLIQAMQRELPHSANLVGSHVSHGSYRMNGVTGSVTVSSNEESTIRAWRVQYRNLKPVIVRTVSWDKAARALIKLYNLEGDDAEAVTVVHAPEFTWNSNLLAGDVYSLEQAEAGNKKP